MPVCLFVAGALPRPPEWLVPLVFMLILSVGTGARCPIRTDTRDVTDIAFVSNHIVEAVVKDYPSYSDQSKCDYSVRVTVTRILKTRKGGRLRKGESLDLTLREPRCGPSFECKVSYLLVLDQKYIFFLGKPGRKSRRHSPPLISAPLSWSRNLRKQIRKISCKDCAKAPNVRSISGPLIEQSGTDTNLTCVIEGYPLPTVNWYKNGEHIPRFQTLSAPHRTIRIHIHSKKVEKRKVKIRDPSGNRRRTGTGGMDVRNSKKSIRNSSKASKNSPKKSRASFKSKNKGRPKKKGSRNRNDSKQEVTTTLQIMNAQLTDSAEYSCRGESIVGHTEAYVNLTVENYLDPGRTVACNFDYCLNGGTCYFFVSYIEYMCSCAEGFRGRRCEEKDVNPSYNANCRGPNENTRHAKGVRCTRNQPLELWEILQQKLKKMPKLSQYSKPGQLGWPTDHNPSGQWLQLQQLAIKSDDPTHSYPRRVYLHYLYPNLFKPKPQKHLLTHHQYPMSPRKNNITETRGVSVRAPFNWTSNMNQQHNNITLRINQTHPPYHNQINSTMDVGTESNDEHHQFKNHHRPRIRHQHHRKSTRNQKQMNNYNSTTSVNPRTENGGCKWCKTAGLKKRTSVP